MAFGQQHTLITVCHKKETTVVRFAMLNVLEKLYNSYQDERVEHY